MAYITQASIESVFGASNVALWSNVANTALTDGEPTADTARIAAAIAYAEGYVEDRFRAGPYTVPFSATGSGFPAVLVDWCAKLAGVWLYKSRGVTETVEGDPVAFHMTEANETMDFYISGARKMACAYASSRPTTTPGVW